MVNDPTARAALDRRHRGLTGAEVDADVAALQSQLDALDARLDDLADMLGTGELYRRGYARAVTNPREERHAVLHKLAPVRDADALAKVPEAMTVAQWEETTTDQRRAILTAIWPDGFTIDPGGRRKPFDPERITFRG